MGQSLVNNYLHIVFNTKGVKSLTYPPIEKELHVYITGICNNLECPALIVGGYTDHIHILCKHSQKTTLMALIQS